MVTVVLIVNSDAINDAILNRCWSMVANRLQAHWLQRVRHDAGKRACPDSTIIGNIMKMRAVHDTNILVAGLASQRGASFALIERALLGHFDLVASPAL